MKSFDETLSNEVIDLILIVNLAITLSLIYSLSIFSFFKRTITVSLLFLIKNE